MSLKEEMKHFREQMKTTRADWIDGPWMDEPDRMAFDHEGYSCIVARGGVGAWCGYVAVPKGHPYFGQPHYCGEVDIDVSVHGGLTYSNSCRGVVCHDKPNDELWWFGFDCAHYGDKYPPRKSFRALGVNDCFDEDHHYWTASETIRETLKLAAQLKGKAYATN